VWPVARLHWSGVVAEVGGAGGEVRVKKEEE
jgi:hypothetical protein